MTQFNSFHDSTTMFATQYIFTAPKLVCTIKQVKFLWCVCLYRAYSLTLVNSILAKKLNCQWWINYGKNSQEETKINYRVFSPNSVATNLGWLLKLIMNYGLWPEPQNNVITSEESWEREDLSALSQLLQLFVHIASGRCHLGSSMRGPKIQKPNRKAGKKIIRHSSSKWKRWNLHCSLFPAGWGMIHIASFKRWVSTITFSWLSYLYLPAGSLAHLCSSGQEHSASKSHNTHRFRHLGWLTGTSHSSTTFRNGVTVPKKKEGSQNVLVKTDSFWQ